MTRPTDSAEDKGGTIGLAMPQTEIKIVDPETGDVVPIGEVGEYLTRGYHVMHGYYGEPQKTAETVDANGWLYSGDLGVMDADGYLRITGRRKEMIIRGGENIYPREIEEFLCSHPKVAQAAVFGVPDAFYGEQVVAWVQPHAGETVDADTLRAWCKDRIAHFKVPRDIRVVDGFRMTVTGKLQKFRMREMTMAESGAREGTAAGERAPP